MAKAATVGRKRVCLECTAEPGAEVFVAGTFNGWNPAKKPMKPVDGGGRYQAVLLLPPGEHEYKYVVGQDWRLDDQNPQWRPNPLGTANSVLRVG